MKLIFRNIALLSFLLQIFYQIGRAQNAPVTTMSTVSGVIPGQQVTVNVTVSNFVNIGSISLSMNYDYSRLHFVSSTINNLLLNAGIFATGDNDIGNGMHEVITGWYGNKTSLPNQTVILTYTFTFLSGSSLLEWFDNGASCSYTDFTGLPLNDTPFSTYYKNGMICGTLSEPGSINGPASVCQGTTGVIYSINPVTNSTRYIWSVPSGSTIRNGVNTNIITVDYPAAPSIGIISVYAENNCGNSLTSTLPVAIVAPPAINAGNDTIIISGSIARLNGTVTGSGAFTFHWSPDSLIPNPAIQNPSSARLTATSTFRFTVTEQSSQCISWDEMKVTVQDLPTGLNKSDESMRITGSAENDFRIFPNPAKNILMLRNLCMEEGTLVISIISSNGKLVKKTELFNCPIHNDLSIDVSDLKPGIYFINIAMKGRKISKRLIII